MSRGKFNLGYTKLASLDMGGLYPIGLTEVIPGDTFQHSVSYLLRCSTMLAPVMHPVTVRIHHWFVPNRLVWDSWEDFITGGPLGAGIPAANFPIMDFSGSSVLPGSLLDYFGIPPGAYPAGGGKFNAMPMRGYGLIWNEFYRDQDLETKLLIPTGDGNTGADPRDIQNCDWEKDYFTSARPWEQKGPVVSVPLKNGTVSRISSTPNSAILYQKGGNTVAGVGNVTSGAGGEAQVLGQGINFDPNGTLTVPAGNVATTDLRVAMALQRYEEAAARYGSRYPEYLRQAFGVRSSDARLQRPEYLGGGQQTIQFSEVLQTGPGTSSAVGDMKGHGIAAGRSYTYRRFFEEHGFVHTLLSVRPKTIYQSGVPRIWAKNSKEMFYTKELAHVGQQSIAKRELFATTADPGGVWGWQDRYDEYRRAESSVAGEFRGTLLNFWHMAREFTSEPALNAAFVKCVPTERIFAVPSQNVLYCMARHKLVARRRIAQVGTSHIF